MRYTLSQYGISLLRARRCHCADVCRCQRDSVTQKINTVSKKVQARRVPGGFGWLLPSGPMAACVCEEEAGQEHSRYDPPAFDSFLHLDMTFRQ